MKLAKQQWSSRMMRLSLVSLLVASMCSCSLNYIDNDGNQHILGVLNMEIQRPESMDPSLKQVDLKSLGISLQSSPVQSSVSVGYSKTTLLAGNINASHIICISSTKVSSCSENWVDEVNINE